MIRSSFHPALALAIGASLLALPARAADPVHVRGTVATIDGTSVSIAATDGKTVGLTLDDSWKLAGVVPASMADIKPNSYIGTANVLGPDGNTALEVVVFPEAMRGAGEGDRGWDLQPKSAMTNATVKSVEGVDGRTVTLAFKGGEKKVTIPANVPIVTIAGATKADVVPGAKVFVSGTPSSDGKTVSGGFIAVGKDGLTPPM